jgi:DNA-binding MarR family transcriptional regulator
MVGSITRRQHTVKSGTQTPRTETGDEFSELVVRVFRLDGLLTAAGDALAEPTGQSTARWRVLAAVEHRPMPVAEIARAWGLARQSVQRIADLLERDGLVAYAENPVHRRAQLVRLTPHGRTTLRRIQAAQRDWANAVGNRLGPDDLRTANRILARVIDALTSAADRRQP